MRRASTSAQTHKQAGDKQEAGKPKERQNENEREREIKARSFKAAERRWTTDTHITNTDISHTRKRNADTDSGKRERFLLLGQKDYESKFHSST